MLRPRSGFLDDFAQSILRQSRVPEQRGKIAIGVFE